MHSAPVGRLLVVMHDLERLGSPSSIGGARGRVEERPWGERLAELARDRYTGQLTLRTPARKVHALAFADGMVVGATSPVAADAVARIALNMRLVVTAPAAMVEPPQPGRERQGSVRDRELESFVVTANLSRAQVQRLKCRLLLQRAARTFAIERGDYTMESRITIPVSLAAGVDMRAVVYEGVRLHLDGDRLVTALAPLGAWFALSADAEAQLARFDFTEAEQPVIAALREGTSVPELEARHRELDPRLVQAVIYALATCGALERMSMPARGTRTNTAAATPAAVPPAPAPLMPVAAPPEPTLPAPAAPAAHVPTLFEPHPPSRTPTPTEQAACVPMLIRLDPEIATPRAPVVPVVPVVSTVARLAREMPRRTHTEPFLEARPTTLRPNALSASELQALIASRSAAIERGADHFALLDVPIGASVEAVRAAYIELARNLRTERLVELRIPDQEFRARGLFAQICIAYTTLTDPERRADYIANLQRSGAPRAADLDFDLLAAEAFERGARALRADDPELAVAELRTACELVPNDISYLATLGHAEFCARSASQRGGDDRT